MTTMKTRFQTVEITFKSSPLMFLSIEEYPPLNEDLRDKMVRWNMPQRIIDDQGDCYTWWPDGRCVVATADGARKVFWPVPTLKDAVQYSSDSGLPAGFFQFHSDGSVTCAAWGGNYYWSAPIYAYEIEGEWMETVWNTEKKGWDYYRRDDGYDSDDSYLTYDSTGHLERHPGRSRNWYKF